MNAHTPNPMPPSVAGSASGAAQARSPRVRSVLFVCTGNTCRSPMAEAIAARLLDDAPVPDRTTVGSAGVNAIPGDRITPEAREALRTLRLDVDGATKRAPFFGTSRVLTRELIAQADEIYGMTRAHVSAVLSLEPTAAGKVHLLDPAGDDIPDPIGHTQSVYAETARRLVGAITRRIKELSL